MPNIKSSIKKARQDVRRYADNRRYRTRIHTLTRKVLESLKAKNREEATNALREMQSAVDKAAKRRVIHKNTAARKIARLSRRLRLAA
ncbi:MAG: 30S ribosomal protein S20 [Candidatus Lindowbacteria bacterium RIFCSPLOWO2_12_FULL_62_27]|nr:MAG: 30S ribosomal protein S20 [Candidatus Lindowbacteria bacterium RIFCSPLOWO2_12_FULL_62_27]OGH62014.1 MAG: 30S ribosomal protein S20 [Candidatus Lindowbacteria bacterium RIFCSPLOWO2_02_FULL_62_12]